MRRRCSSSCHPSIAFVNIASCCPWITPSAVYAISCPAGDISANFLLLFSGVFIRRIFVTDIVVVVVIIFMSRDLLPSPIVMSPRSSLSLLSSQRTNLQMRCRSRGYFCHSCTCKEVLFNKSTVEWRFSDFSARSCVASLKLHCIMRNWPADTARRK